MSSTLSVLRDFSLRQFNTFGIDANASAWLEVNDPAMLPRLRVDPHWGRMPRVVLGGGSNILFTGDYAGLVLHMATSGIAITGQTSDAVLVTAAAGENWHGLVQWTLQNGLAGLENLSLIPGSVGASPIQNIGAYGVELEDRFHALTLFDFASGEVRSLDRGECKFAYRDSVFKRELRDRIAVISVTFALPKRWQPTIDYADLAAELDASGIAVPTPVQVSDAVIAVRRRKLPDPADVGNAGSFFKNPVVTAAQRNALLARYPQLVSYPQRDGSFKLAAGWLIDQCGWKGKENGAAAVYDKQALVLVNRGGATGDDVRRLATAIQTDVLARFDVSLEPEPVFI